jgi:alpha-tubulin suppressor-like RCC1 family protein
MKGLPFQSFVLAAAVCYSGVLTGAPLGRILEWEYDLSSLPASQSGGIATSAHVVMSNVVITSAGLRSGLVVRSNGEIVPYGRVILPAWLTNVSAISIGETVVALKRDGTVTNFGGRDMTWASTPPGLSNVVAVSAGTGHCLALKRDGVVVGWGDKRLSRGVPAGVTNIVAVGARPSINGRDIALKSDGTVLEWSLNGPIEAGRYPVMENGVVTGYTSKLVDVLAVDGLSNVVRIAIGDEYGAAGPARGFSLALKSDGTVFGWGANGQGQATGITSTNAPFSDRGLVTVGGQLLSNVVAIAAGYYGLALKSDGAVVSWGYVGRRQVAVPGGLGHVVAIAAEGNSYYALVTNSDEPSAGK